MAVLSFRERIILADIALLSALTQIKSCIRELPTQEGLSQFALTQLPVLSVVGRLPVPEEKRVGRDGSVSVIISRLNVDVAVYFQERLAPDAMISSLLDAIWKKLYEDQRRGGLVISTELTPEEEPLYWDPFVAFKIVVSHRYQHTIGGV